MQIQIDDSLFWKIYTALHDAESVLWRCDGATNPEDDDLAEEILETHSQVENALDKLQPIVETLKQN